MTQDLALRLVAESSSSILKRLAILRHKYILNDGNLMADKFKPLNYNPRFVYDADYWNIVFQDAYHFFWNSLMWGLTGKFPFSPRRIIVYCGNPECFSLIAYYPDQRPTTCNKCGKEIDWG
jgi:hypothetical protein